MRTTTFHAGQRRAEAGLIESFASGLLRSAARETEEPLIPWAKKYLPHYVPLEVSPFHEWLAGELEVMSVQRGVRLLTIAGRDSAKSTWISAIFPLYCFCRGTDPYIILSAKTSGQAMKHVSAIRDELETNERIAADYPDVFGRGSVWQESSLTLRSGQRLECVGAGQSIRGRKRGADRPSLIVVDDPEENDSIYSETTRDRRFAWLQSAVKYAGSPDTNIILVGTMLHNECTVARTMSIPGWRGRKIWRSIEQFPERMDLWDQWEDILNRDEGAADEFLRQHHDEMHKGADVLWPDRVSLVDLMKERAQDRASFARERQNEPLAPDGCRFDMEWFRGDELWWDDPPGNAHILAAVDPATGKNKKAGDYSAIVWAWWEPGNPCLYIDAHLTREGPVETNTAFVQIHQRYNIELAAYEAIAFQEVARGDLVDRMARAGTNVPIIPATQKDNKFLRIDRLSGLLQRRRLRFRRGSEGARLLVQQLQHYSFPAVDKLDGPDALEMLVRLIGYYARARKNPGGARLAGLVLT